MSLFEIEEKKFKQITFTNKWRGLENKLIKDVNELSIKSNKSFNTCNNEIRKNNFLQEWLIESIIHKAWY